MSVSQIIKDLDNLVTANEESRSLTIEEALFKKITELSKDETEHMKLLENTFSQNSPFQNEKWWKYLYVLMQKLLQLKYAFIHADEKESLISVNELKSLKASLQMLVSLGILAHLSPGIGIPLEKRSSFNKDMISDVNELQKTYCLNLVLRCIMSLREEERLKKLLTCYIGDYLAAIFQLLLNNESLNTHNKLYLQNQLSLIIEETSQSVLIKELLLLYGNKDCPPKLSRALRLIMIERLLKDNGVISTSKAILDVAGDKNSPKQWSTLTLLAKLIATPHHKQQQMYRDKIYPQILKLLSTSEFEFAQLAVLCVRTVHEAEPEICRKYFIDVICEPLTRSSSEEELDSCIEILYNCIGIPLSKHWSLPVNLFNNIFNPLFRLFCFVNTSVSHIKGKLQNIVLSIIAQDMDYHSFVFGKTKLKFNFGEHGGVYTDISNEEELTPWGDATDILLNLVEQDDNLKVNLFKAVVSSMEGDLEKRLVGARVLSELSSSPAVLKWIELEPSGMINFIRSLLQYNYEEEITCLGLMVLSILLNCNPRNKDRNWSEFDSLIEPLKLFKSKSNNTELRILADELYSTILTRGVITNESKNKQQTHKKEKYGHYAQTLKDISDPLLPIRAHALREMGKLIISKDPEAVRNKETIFCLFKENLKSDDSYVYLSAIEGLASLAGMYPDEVVVTFTEQFVYSKIPETRLKIGEVLMRVIRILGEMAAVYKNEIINALLFGCRDSDHIVRASSISNLGELCRILTFRIHAFMQEIFECIKCIFESDKAMEPRRAAVMLLALLLKGLGSDALVTLEPILVNIYRMLKYIYNYEKDDITKLHAQLAIEELNHSTVMFLSPPQSLKKHIFVLHPPK